MDLLTIVWMYFWREEEMALRMYEPKISARKNIKRDPLKVVARRSSFRILKVVGSFEALSSSLSFLVPE